MLTTLDWHTGGFCALPKVTERITAGMRMWAKPLTYMTFFIVTSALLFWQLRKLKFKEVK